MTTNCPPEALAELLAAANVDTEGGLDRVGALIAEYREDARLHFLQGSLLAALRRYDEAHGAMSHAVALQPDYDLARFQLGLLELSSGRPDLAGVTLSPLAERAEDDPMRVLGDGLRRLIDDDLPGAAETLRRGVALNPDNEAINRDMEMLIAEIERTAAAPASAAPATQPAPAPEEVTSSAQLLLQQFGRKPTRH